ncbi:MAG: GAF domain-containing protein [Spirochaetaceae bacterium]|jgi:GAF domain-containing protein|nr:GAF domain-containing protein [Spirochaetaceae bacterium]
MVEARKNENAEEQLSLLPAALEALLKDDDDLVSGLANAAAALKLYLDDINWAGFYLLKDKTLVLGPFQGLPACTRIGEGKGVCGKAALDGKTLVVPDVHAFPGHIACDSASASEIVVPLFRAGKVFAVLDIDSPRPGRFGPAEEAILTRAGNIISAWASGLIL